MEPDKSYFELAEEELAKADKHSRPRGEWGYTEYHLKRAAVYASLAAAKTLEDRK